MAGKIADQLLWIMDYEEHLDTGRRMPKKGERWVKQHIRQLDTPLKRAEMKEFYRPCSIESKPFYEYQHLPKAKRQLLAQSFKSDYLKAKAMGASEDNLLQMISNYKKRGTTWRVIEDVTGYSKNKLKGKGI